MPGSMKRETEGAPPLVTSREPKGPKRAGDKGSMGDQALMDGLAIVIGCWVLLFVLMFSLRSFNI